MRLADIVTFWASQRRNSRGEWIHPDDAEAFVKNPHTFNLDFPVSPYVGNVLAAPIIILGANAGYHEKVTPKEFSDGEAIERYLKRVRDPSRVNWSAVAPYYDAVNYGALLVSGQAVLVNACAYRSPRISGEPANRRLIERLDSVRMTRNWLLEAVLPLAAKGERLVIAKRPGLWKLSASVRSAAGVVFDPAPVSARITSKAWEAVQEWKKRAGMGRC